MTTRGATLSVLPMRLTFIVPGEAVPQGSMRGFVVRTKSGAHRAVVTSDNRRMKPWRAMVSDAAREAQAAQGTWPQVSTAAIALAIECYFVRPASVSAKKRPHYTVRPDSSKLLRAIEDALTKVLWRDDSQVVDTLITKAYAAPGASACVLVTVREVEDSKV